MQNNRQTANEQNDISCEKDDIQSEQSEMFVNKNEQNSRTKNDASSPSTCVPMGGRFYS